MTTQAVAPKEDSVSRGESMRDLEREVGLLMRRARHRIAQRAAEVDPELNPTAYLMLRNIAEHGPRRASDLCGALATDKGTTSRLVHHLAERGLIDRSPDPDDGRASVLTVSDHGRERLEAINVTRQEALETALSDWDTEEIATLAAMIGRLNAATG